MYREFIAVVVMASLAGAGLAVAQEARMAVTGEGVVSVEPDVAVVRLGVVFEGDTPGAAVTGLAEALDPVLAGLIDDGIAPNDVQTGVLSLRPVYARDDGNRPDGAPSIDGYVAESALSITVRASGDLGGVISRAVSAGGNTLDGLNWQLSDPQAAQDAALAAAVADAARKAALMAETAGIGLGDIVEVNEVSGAAEPFERMPMEARLASDVPVARGSMDVRATVRVVYSVQDQ